METACHLVRKLTSAAVRGVVPSPMASGCSVACNAVPLAHKVISTPCHGRAISRGPIKPHRDLSHHTAPGQYRTALGHIGMYLVLGEVLSAVQLERLQPLIIAAMLSHSLPIKLLLLPGQRLHPGRPPAQCLVSAVARFEECGCDSSRWCASQLDPPLWPV